MKQILELGLDRHMMTQIIISYSCETHNLLPPLMCTSPTVVFGENRVGFSYTQTIILKAGFLMENEYKLG